MTETMQGKGNFQPQPSGDRKNGHFVGNGEPKCFPNTANRRNHDPMGKTMGIGNGIDETDRVGPMVGRPEDDTLAPGARAAPRSPSGGWDPDDLC